MPGRSVPLAVMPSPVPSSHWDGLLAVDLFAPCGTAWLAAEDGVVDAYDVPLGGHACTLYGDSGTNYYYAHGCDSAVAGRVQAGQVIGCVDQTGNAEGKPCHLHWAVGQIDSNGAGTIAPWDWIAAVQGSVSVGGIVIPTNTSPMAVVLIGLAAAFVVWRWL